MSVIIEAGVLARAMKAAAAVVESRNTIPILSNVRIESRGTELELVTSNLDIEYRQRVPIVSGDGIATTIDAKKLSALASAVEAGAQIALEVKDKRLAVKSGRSRWVLPMLPVDDFPMLPFAQSAEPITMPGKDLAASIARTAWSVSTEETRYYLMGIFLNPEEGKLRMTATDGHKLVCVTTPIDWPNGANDAIAPIKYVRALERLAADADQVSLRWSDDKIRAEVGAITLTGKLINGTFPDYRRVIPPAQTAAPVVDPEQLRKAIRRIDLIGSDKTRTIKLGVRDGCLALEMTSAEHGTASEEVPADAAQAHEAGFNSAYLAQMLEALGGDTVELHQADPNAPAMLRRAIADGAVGVVMPMRI